MPGGGAYNRPTQKNKALPPLEAWKEPEKWLIIDSQDTILGVRSEVRNTIRLPTDERQFVIIREAVRQLLGELFEEDYVWDVDPSDPTKQLDNHHVYHYRRWYLPEKFDGNDTPHRFRECYGNRIMLPRQFHNVLHALTLPPIMPSLEHMEAYLEAYNEVSQTVIRLGEVAAEIVRIQGLFVARRKRLGEAFSEEDAGYLWLAETFQKEYSTYQRLHDEIEGHRQLQADIVSTIIPQQVSRARRPGATIRAAQAFHKHVVRRRGLVYTEPFRGVA